MSNAKTKIPCSVPILTLRSKANLEKILPRLIEVFDDVYLVDGNSTDGTREYAQSLGVRVENQYETQERDVRIKDFAQVRYTSWKFARYGWIFMLDSDEYLPDATIECIRSIVEADIKTVTHWFHRYPVYHGRTIRYSPFDRAHYLRLFHTSQGVTLAERLVHERFVVPPTVACQNHDEWIDCPLSDIEHMRERTNRYIDLEARSVSDTSWRYLLRWILWYNVRSFVGQSVLLVVYSIRAITQSEPMLPWEYSRLYLMYRWKTLYRATLAWWKLRRKA